MTLNSFWYCSETRLHANTFLIDFYRFILRFRQYSKCHGLGALTNLHPGAFKKMKSGATEGSINLLANHTVPGASEPNKQIIT